MRSTAPWLKTFAARGLLALALLFAQQTAALHWLAHAVDATQAKAGKAHLPGDRCDECLTLNAFGAAAPSGATSLPPAPATRAAPPTPPDAPSPAATRLAFRSRAPPVLT